MSFSGLIGKFNNLSSQNNSILPISTRPRVQPPQTQTETNRTAQTGREVIVTAAPSRGTPLSTERQIAPLQTSPAKGPNVKSLASTLNSQGIVIRMGAPQPAAPGRRETSATPTRSLPTPTQSKAASVATAVNTRLAPRVTSPTLSQVQEQPRSLPTVPTRALPKTPMTSTTSTAAPLPWIAGTKRMLSSTIADADALITTLSMNPQLKNCYQKDAGVSQGYSIGQHSKMVIEAAMKFQATLEPKLGSKVTWNEFLLFLALHDIGKGLALEQNRGEVFGTDLTFKDKELSTTQAILEEAMKAIGVPASKLVLFKELLRYDTQGLYLKEEIGIEEAENNILEMAHNAKMDPAQFYSILEAFHMADAVSYPELRSIFTINGGRISQSSEGSAKVQELKNRFDESKKGQIILKELMQGVARRENPLNLVDKFEGNLPVLYRYLQSVHQKMLRQGIESTPEDQKLYKDIKKDFKQLYSYLIRGLGRDPKEPRAIFWKKKSENVELFSDELENFHANYVMRFSFSKVESYLRSKGVTISPEILKLLMTTHLHGGNSAILPNLFMTGMKLMPTGRLFKKGIVPLSGELNRGATAVGINRFQISGVKFSHANVAERYFQGFRVENSQYKTNIEDFLKRMAQRLQTNKEQRSNESYFAWEENAFIGSSLPTYSAGILRLRATYPEIYQTVEPELKKLILKMKSDWAAYKNSANYRLYMPQELDPTGTLGYQHEDGYYYKFFVWTETGIESLVEALDRPIVVPPGIKEATTKIYGMIFGSTTGHTVMEGIDGERCSPKEMALGKDIQTIFVKKENVPSVQTYLAGNQLDRKVSVLDMQAFEEAAAAYKQAAPFLNHYYSSKKAL